MSNPTDFFNEKAKQIAEKPEALAGINATYQFNLSGDDGGSWVIALTDDNKSVTTGEDENAQCIISMSSADFMGMIGGSLNPQMAFMTGKLRVKGDMALALKLQAILA